MKMKTNWMASIFAVILCGCSNSPRGFYVSETPRSTYCLEFKSHGKVIIRDLTSSYFAEQNYTVEKKVIRIDAFKVAGVTSAIEFSIDGNRLINANGLQFKKDTSGKTYTPLERVAEANKLTAQAELTQRQVALKEKEKEVAELKIKSEREKASAEQQRLAALSRLEQDRIAALSKQAEEEQARAIEQSKLDKENAKRYAAAHLPLFTNQIVTVTCNDGTTYSNICLRRASLDGVVFGYTDATGGGVIPYPKLPISTLESLNIDTNMIDVWEERALVKSEVDRQYNQMLAQQGAPAANAYRKNMTAQLSSYGAQEAFAMRYGIRRPIPQLQLPLRRYRR